MQKYRKKPIVIEACELTERTEEEIFKWSGGNVIASPVIEPTGNNPTGKYWQVKTLEGIMIASQHDFIIKGINGEFYPCKPDIFHKTYERVN